MNRLKNLLLRMDARTATYREMYEGPMIIATPNGQTWEAEDNIYYNGEIGYEITGSHKLAQDKPTVTVMIPAEMLGLATVPAVANHCLREFLPYIDELNADLYNRSRPDNENGKYIIPHPGGEILPRNSSFFALCPQKSYQNGGGIKVYVSDDGVPHPPRLCLCLRMQVQLPKNKLSKTMRMLCKDLPDAVNRYIAQFDAEKLGRMVALAEKQTAIRAWLKDSGYCAFIANGSILPRFKETDLPMENAIPFQSAPEDEIEVCGVRGMGIRRGVTVITGGGYSGKSTLLDAISAGIYDHVTGDGRELCITDDTAMTISAEDGRSVKSVNISPFVKWLPGGDPHDFSTEHASGSTSQAANIMEAVDCGAKLLLIDEDRSATNFMIRDQMMKELIEREPLTPFTDRANELYQRKGVSTVLVIGGSGEYLAIADRVYLMDEFRICDVTAKSKEICTVHGVLSDFPAPTVWEQQRVLLSDRFSSYPEGSGTEKLEVSDLGYILIGDESIDIRGLHDILSNRQLDSLGYMLRYLEIRNTDAVIDLNKKIDDLYDTVKREGLDTVFSPFFTTTGRFLDLPRKQELKAVINRMRKIVIQSNRRNLTGNDA